MNLSHYYKSISILFNQLATLKKQFLSIAYYSTHQLFEIDNNLASIKNSLQRLEVKNEILYSYYKNEFLGIQQPYDAKEAVGSNPYSLETLLLCKISDFRNKEFKINRNSFWSEKST